MDRDTSLTTEIILKIWLLIFPLPPPPPPLLKYYCWTILILTHCIHSVYNSNQIKSTCNEWRFMLCCQKSCCNNAMTFSYWLILFIYLYIIIEMHFVLSWVYHIFNINEYTFWFKTISQLKRVLYSDRDDFGPLGTQVPRSRWSH